MPRAGIERFRIKAYSISVKNEIKRPQRKDFKSKGH